MPPLVSSKLFIYLSFSLALPRNRKERKKNVFPSRQSAIENGTLCRRSTRPRFGKMADNVGLHTLGKEVIIY